MTGRRFYYAGHNWEVERETTHDNEPAVRLRCIDRNASTSRSRYRPTVVTRLFLRYAVEKA